MKKFYLLSSAVVLLAMSTFAQNVPNPGPSATNGKYVGTAPSITTQQRSAFICPDTTGLIDATNFLPNFAPSGSLWIYSYTGGGYIYGNNVAGYLNICAQGYNNVGPVPVKVKGAIIWPSKKEHDIAGASSTSAIVIGAYAVAANQAYNTNGSGTFNSTTKNWPGPTTIVPVTTANILFSAVDTTLPSPYNYALRGNYVAFATPPTFTGDFAISLDARATSSPAVNGLPAGSLAPGDTLGLLSDKLGDAGNMDYAFCLASGYSKWYAMDQVYSSAASPALGSGGLDMDIAIFAVLCDATGVEEYFNGMKLTTYPNPATDHTTIEYTLEKNSTNVSLRVFDLSGKEILNKEYSTQAAGTYTVNVETSQLAAGSYFYQLRANGHNFTKEIVVAAH